MKKIEQFQITSLMLSGFKSYEEPTELVFGNPTVITGGNGRGKSSIADAIAFAVTGCPFFGERGIDRLHNENNPDVAIRMCFVDETGTLHELNRTRRKNRMTITYDGYEIRQLDLADLFGERDVFLSMEQRCASLAEQASAETERLRAEIQTLTADLEYGNLSQAEYDRLGTCREELRQSEAKIAALQDMTAAQLPDFDREIAQANSSIAEIKRKMANVIAYISKRAELTFSQLKMNRVEISLYDVVKSTGEVKDTFKFQYGGRRYDRLSLSEKIRAGMEVSELMKRLTGRNYPVFVDNMESVDDLANVRPTGQIIMAKCVSGAALQVKPIRPIAFAEQRAA